MNRRLAGLLLLPFSFLLLMTPKARSRKTPASPSKSAATAPSPQKDSSGPASLSVDQKKWVESSLRQMTLEEKVGQLIFATYHGSFTATDSYAYSQMMHDLNDLHVGGFITITHGSPLGTAKTQA